MDLNNIDLAKTLADRYKYLKEVQKKFQRQEGEINIEFYTAAVWKNDGHDRVSFSISRILARDALKAEIADARVKLHALDIVLEGDDE